MKVCESCRTKNPNKAKFCMECGNKFISKEESLEQNVEDVSNDSSGQSEDITYTDDILQETNEIINEDPSKLKVDYIKDDNYVINENKSEKQVKEHVDADYDMDANKFKEYAMDLQGALPRKGSPIRDLYKKLFLKK